LAPPQNNKQCIICTKLTAMDTAARWMCCEVRPGSPLVSPAQRRCLAHVWDEDLQAEHMCWNVPEHASRFLCDAHFRDMAADVAAYKSLVSPAVLDANVEVVAACTRLAAGSERGAALDEFRRVGMGTSAAEALASCRARASELDAVITERTVVQCRYFREASQDPGADDRDHGAIRRHLGFLRRLEIQAGAFRHAERTLAAWVAADRVEELREERRVAEVQAAALEPCSPRPQPRPASALDSVDTDERALMQGNLSSLHAQDVARRLDALPAGMVATVDFLGVLLRRGWWAIVPARASWLRDVFRTTCEEEDAEICVVLWCPASPGAGRATLGAFVPIEFARGTAPPMNTFMCDVPTPSIWAGTSPLALLRHVLAYDAHVLKRAVCGPYVQLMRDGMPVEFRASWACDASTTTPTPLPTPCTHPALMTFRALYEHQCIARGQAAASSAPQLMLLGGLGQGRRGFPSLFSTLARDMSAADAVAAERALRCSCALLAGLVPSTDAGDGSGSVVDVYACFRTSYDLLHGGSYDGQWALKLWVCDAPTDVDKLRPRLRDPRVAFVVGDSVLSAREFDELEAAHGTAGLDAIQRREYEALVAADPGMACPIKYAEAMHLTFDLLTQFGMKAAWVTRNAASGVLGGSALKQELSSVLQHGADPEDMMRGALLLHGALRHATADAALVDPALWAFSAPTHDC
jgi:hypothetical protein